MLSLGLAFAVVPSVEGGSIPTGTGELLVTTLTQVVVGSALGLVTYVLLAAVATAGSLIDTFGGFQLAQGFDPLSMNMNTVFGKLHQMLAVMILFATGRPPAGPRRAAAHLRRPAARRGAAGSTAPPTCWSRRSGCSSSPPCRSRCRSSRCCSSPTSGLALLTKVAPHLNAINVMFPAKIGLTLLLLGLSFPVLPEAVARLVELANEAQFALVGGG